MLFGSLKRRKNGDSRSFSRSCTTRDFSATLCRECSRFWRRCVAVMVDVEGVVVVAVVGGRCPFTAYSMRRSRASRRSIVVRAVWSNVLSIVVEYRGGIVC